MFRLVFERFFLFFLMKVVDCVKPSLLTQNTFKLDFVWESYSSRKGKNYFGKSLLMETFWNWSFHIWFHSLSSLPTLTPSPFPLLLFLRQISRSAGHLKPWNGPNLFFSSFSSMPYPLLVSHFSMTGEIKERKIQKTSQIVHHPRPLIKPIWLQPSSGLWSPPHQEPNATALGSIHCRMMANWAFEILVTRNFQGKFMHFHFELEFVASIKVNPYAIMNILMKFQGH